MKLNLNINNTGVYDILYILYTLYYILYYILYNDFAYVDSDIQSSIKYSKIIFHDIASPSNISSFLVVIW